MFVVLLPGCRVIHRNYVIEIATLGVWPIIVLSVWIPWIMKDTICISGT